MSKKLYAKRMFHAIENIDAEWLYDARAYRAPKIKPYLRYAAAAVIVLAVLSAALFLSAENAVQSFLTVDTNYGVTLELNADHRVVNTAASATLYDMPAKACRGQEAEDALSRLLGTMRERGGLNENANTILFGVPQSADRIADEWIGAVQTKNACIVRVTIKDQNAAQKLAKKRRITVGKAAYLLLLNGESKEMNESLLFRLSANDIALLAESKGITADGISVSGSPASGGCLSEKAVRKIALNASGISPRSIECALDSDGFRLIYTVLLYEGDKGVAYVIDAASGEIRREIRGAATTLQEKIDKVREEYVRESDNTPADRTAPVMTPAGGDDQGATPSTEHISDPAAADSPATASERNDNTQTDAPSVIPEATEQIFAADEPAPGPETIVPTEKPTAPQQPSEKPAAPTDKPTEAVVIPTEPGMIEAPAPQRSYITAKQWDELPPLDDIRVVTAALNSSSSFSANDRYGSCLMGSAQAAAQYRADEPSRCKGMDYETPDYDRYSLAAVETRERFSNENLNTVIFFVRGDTLYVGVFEHTANTPLQKGGRDVRYDYKIWKEEIAGVKQLKMVQLSYDDVFSSSLESMYFHDSRLDNLKRNTWCEEIPEDIFSTKYMVDANLRLFNDTLLAPYPREVDLSDNIDAYDHTAWLIRSDTGLTAFRRSVDSKLANLHYPSATYMLTHALLMTTYVERYNIYSYYARAWKKDGVLYVAFADESNQGFVRKPLDKPYVRVGMIEFEYEQVKDVDRVEIVHVQYQGSRYGTDYVSVEPWDE